jgi:type I restriction enzyme S subunit
MPYMTATATKDEIEVFCLNADDVVITKDSENWLDIAVPAYIEDQSQDWVCGYHLAILRPRSEIIIGKYLHWCLQGIEVSTQFSVSANGVTRYGLSHGDIKNVSIHVPGAEEQTQIARFLDWKTAQINRFIRNKRRLIELLKEQKQNIINQAVTRGLDPNVKLKPSGVEWIGDIPEHWEEIPLKQIARADNSGSYGVEPELGGVVLPVATTAQIDKDGSFLVKKMPIRGFTEAEAKRYSCKPGEILVVKSSGSISNVITGKAGIFSEDTPDFAFSNFLMRLTAKREKVLPLYLFYLLTSHLTRERVKRMVAGSTYPNLRVGEYLSSKLPLPEITEQSAICDFIQRETSVLDQAITRAGREIELMREYRTRLISDVVTGQVDVRGIKVPEVAEKEMPALDEDAVESDDVIDDELETEDDAHER